MSGSATLTIVTSRSSMKVATETRTRVHHLRSMPRTLNGQEAELNREVAELVADPSVEARAGQLGEPADRLDEAHLQLLAAREEPELLPVEGDFDRLAVGRVGDGEDV